MNRRGNRGQITELAPALALFVFGFLLPAIDVGVVMMRYAIAQWSVQTHAESLALAQTFSQAQNESKTDQRYKPVPAVAEIENATVTLDATALKNGETASFVQARHVYAGWLPSGWHAPCNYDLRVTEEATIKPLFFLQVPGISVPGLTRPLHLQLEGRAKWQNLSIDPGTRKYYMAE